MSDAKSERISLETKPDIIAKASPDIQKIEAKAIAGVTIEDIIERNVIAEHRNTDEGIEPEAANSDEHETNL